MGVIPPFEINIHILNYGELILMKSKCGNSKHQNPNIKQIPITQIQNSKQTGSSQTKQKISDSRELNLTWATVHCIGWVEYNLDFVGFRFTQHNLPFCQFDCVMRYPTSVDPGNQPGRGIQSHRHLHIKLCKAMLDSNDECSMFWTLNIGVWDLFGFWSLGFGIFSSIIL
jgi:hypothetical protein